MNKIPQITISTTIQVSVDQAWYVLNEPQHIMQWLHASDDWYCPQATNDVRVGGELRCRMAARDASYEFELVGRYTHVAPQHQLTYVMEDGRVVTTRLEPIADGVKIIQQFDPENENPIDMQREGWQAILNNLKVHAERVF